LRPVTGAPTGAHTLVTGAAGFIGRWVVAELATRGVPCIPVEHSWQSLSEVEAIMGGNEVDRCIHLGWYTRPDDYLTSRAANRRCLEASLDLAELLLRNDCRHLVVSGTSAEYAGSDVDLDEDAPLAPSTFYGATKGSLRLLLRNSWCQQGRGLAWARIFSVTGPGEHPQRLFPTVVRALAAGLPVDLSDGAQVRDFLDVRDVAAALVALSQVEASGDYNVSSGRSATVREFLQSLTACVGGDHLLRFGAQARHAGEAAHVVGRNRRLLEATDWRPRYPVETTLCELASGRTSDGGLTGGRA
jgi:nucleoside-diphosphate-sugar epimerase